MRAIEGEIFTLTNAVEWGRVGDGRIAENWLRGRKTYSTKQNQELQRGSSGREVYGNLLECLLPMKERMRYQHRLGPVTLYWTYGSFFWA